MKLELSSSSSIWSLISFSGVFHSIRPWRTIWKARLPASSLLMQRLFWTMKVSIVSKTRNTQRNFSPHFHKIIKNINWKGRLFSHLDQNSKGRCVCSICVGKNSSLLMKSGIILSLEEYLETILLETDLPLWGSISSKLDIWEGFNWQLTLQFWSPN